MDDFCTLLQMLVLVWKRDSPGLQYPQVVYAFYFDSDRARNSDNL